MTNERKKMEIQARLNNVHVRTLCVVCGDWERPDEVAYSDENGHWVCDPCIQGGVRRIRDNLLRTADHYHELASQYAETAEEEINILPVSDEVQRGAAEREAYYKRQRELDELDELHRTGGRYVPYVLGREDHDMPLEQAIEDD
jgi:hypothetical protein